MKPKILTTSWHPGSANGVYPVVKKIREENLAEVICIGHETAEAVFKAAKVDYLTIQDYGIKDVSLESMRQIIDIESPDLVLVGASAQDQNRRQVIEQNTISAAREKGIPSLSIIEFWASDNRLIFSDICAPENLCYLPDKIAIMDEIHRQRMLAEGFPAEKLVVTGSPAFDNLGELVHNHDTATIRKEIGLLQENYVVMYASDISKEMIDLGYGFDNKDVIKAICSGIMQLDAEKQTKLTLVLKKHPREEPRVLEEMLQYAGHEGISTRTTDYNTRLTALASDLVVAPASTVLFEALLMGRDVLSLQPGRKIKDSWVLTSMDIIAHSYQEEESIRLIKEIISCPETALESYRKKQSSIKVDGKAAERVAQLAYSVLHL